MSLFINRSVLWVFFLGVVYLFGWVLQSSLPLNWDVNWLLIASQRLLNGGTYSKDFFETTPPMILYLSIPPVWIAKVFSISLVLSFRLYVFALSAVSLYLCGLLNKKIFSQNDPGFSRVFLIMIAVVLLILPIYEFGQREHLLVILTLPYLLAVTCVLKQQNIPFVLAAVVGVLAGIGFAIKPFFLITPVLMELFVIGYQRKWHAFVRIDTVAIGCVVLAYLMIALSLHPDYFSIVMPFVARNYYQSVRQPWGIIFWAQPALYCYFIGVFYCLQYKYLRDRSLNAVIFIAMASDLVIYAIQQTSFYYHIYPALAMALLLSFLLFSDCLLKVKQSKLELAGLIALSGIIFVFLCHATPVIWTTLLFAPSEYYLYFAILFFVLLCSAMGWPIKPLKLVFILFSILALSYSVSNLMLLTEWHSHRFVITTLLLFSLFVILVPSVRQSKFNYAVFAGVGTIIFAFPCYYVSNLYYGEMSLMKANKKLVSFIETQSPRQVYFIAKAPSIIFPVINQAGVQSASRFSFFWMMPELASKAPLEARDRDFLTEMVAEDLNANKPSLVFVDARGKEPYLRNASFDYLSYFMVNSHFKSAWQSYRYLATLRDPANFEFDVYKRI